MKKLLLLIRILFTFSILTMLTQVGGVIYLLYLPFSFYIKGEKIKRWKSFVIRLFGYSILYFLICLFLIPLLAKNYGRVPLPVFANEEIPVKAGNILFYLANRHYVTTELRDAYFEVAKKVRKKYPEVQLVHLDANFPLFKKFPLLPHLSHNDGKKLDITFIYKKQKSNKFYNKTFSFTGYGVMEKPNEKEFNQAEACKEKGAWQYSILKKITLAKVKKGYVFDEDVNRYLIQELCKNKFIKKIFIEPHLKQRLRLEKFSKVRFHGCHAVRHDDHIHFQL